jgi:hypothetical protein
VFSPGQAKRGESVARAGQQLQQTGISFIIRQQVQPAFIMALQQSQHAWIIAAHSLSPLVQVKQTPFSVVSHLHRPITRLQQQASMPFIIMQQLHMPPAILVQRSWSMPAEVVSSQVHVTFIPPGHFSIFIVHRGTILMLVQPGLIAGVFMGPAAGAAMPIPLRSIIIALAMESHPIRIEVHRSHAGPSVEPAPDDHYDKHNRYFNFGMAKNQRIGCGCQSSPCRRSFLRSAIRAARPPQRECEPCRSGGIMGRGRSLRRRGARRLAGRSRAS